MAERLYQAGVFGSKVRLHGVCGGASRFWGASKRSRHAPPDPAAVNQRGHFNSAVKYSCLSVLINGCYVDTELLISRAQCVQRCAIVAGYAIREVGLCQRRQLTCKAVQLPLYICGTNTRYRRSFSTCQTKTRVYAACS
jgi:hypothetical protein